MVRDLGFIEWLAAGPGFAVLLCLVAFLVGAYITEKDYERRDRR